LEKIKQVGFRKLQQLRSTPQKGQHAGIFSQRQKETGLLNLVGPNWKIGEISIAMILKKFTHSLTSFAWFALLQPKRRLCKIDAFDFWQMTGRKKLDQQASLTMSGCCKKQYSH
jgi:hypothetical protein